MTTNPLLSNAPLPRFSVIKPEHALTAITELVKQSKAEIERLALQKTPTWESLMAPLEDIADRFDKAFSPVSHLNAVTNTPEWREAYNQCLPVLTEYGTWTGQFKPLFDATLALRRDEVWSTLDSAQQKIINDEIKYFELSGVALEGEDKAKFAQLNQKMSELTTKFEENILDATNGWQYHTEELALLEGLPEHTLAMAQETARAKGLDGWVLTLDFPCYLAVMEHAANESLRKTFYEAYVTRASELGPTAGKFDNSEVMVDILKVRKQKASLLGFSHYADLSLAKKMAKDSDTVIHFLNDLAERSKSLATQNLEELKSFAKQDYDKDSLSAWDLSYYSEKLLKHQYAVSQEELRPYFPEDVVFNGMFKVVNDLYGMTIKELPDIDAWNDLVRLFEITDKHGHVRGRFFTDLYARPHKRGGAWMDGYCGRRKLASGEVQVPVAYLVCNFTKPLAGKAALLTHDEVVTLFHEFGHGLHHMLTQVDYLSASGINNVAWDAVELPSQFMENFCWETSVIPNISKHFETGEPLHQHLFDNMLAAKNFQSGLKMLRQLEFALFDFQLHMVDVESASQVQALLDSVRAAVSVLPPPEFNRFQHSFSHIFAGGYAAGYYSYKWAEVLSSDAFACFEEQGVMDRTTGEAFLNHVLEKGGSAEALDLFVAFRGREPKVDALLRHSGIVDVGAH